MRTILGYTMRSFIAFLCLLTAIFISTTQITKQQKDDGLILNISGRQRMLTQQIIKEVLICSNMAARNRQVDLNKLKAEVFATIKVFESTLYALKDGGRVPINSTMAQFRECPPAATKEIDSQLEHVFSIWISIKNNIDRVLYSECTDSDAMTYVVNHNMELMQEIDKAVLLMQYNAERKVKLMAQIQIFSIAVGIMVVIFSILMIKINIVNPINYIAKAAEAMSMGNLNYDLKRGGLKEIVELSKSMDRLRVSTVKVMERLNR